MQYVNKKSHKRDTAAVPSLKNTMSTIDGIEMLCKRLFEEGFTSI